MHRRKDITMNIVTYLSSNCLVALRLACSLFLVLCLAIAPSPVVSAAISLQHVFFTDIQGGELLNQQGLDLDAGAEQAKQASEGIFQGLEQAKEEVGKTQTRKQSMDYGHQKASDKLEELAERTQAAQTPEDLNPADRMFVKNLGRQD
jgi:hypothetical protein